MASFIDIEDILNDYSEAVSDGIADEVVKLSKESKAQMKIVSPKRTGKYASGWTIKTTRKKGYIECQTWNKKHYRLTHLLERPHVIRNKYGTWGTTHPKSEGEISKEQNRVNQEIMRKVNEIIKNGG